MKRALRYVTLVLFVSAVGAYAQEEQFQKLNSVLLSQVQITVVKQRFTNRISGVVQGSEGTSIGSLSPSSSDERGMILVLTLKVEKPRGKRFELHQGDFILAYRNPDPEQEDWDARSKVMAIRIIGQSPDDDPNPWHISCTGYAAQRDPELDEASVVYAELAFVVENPVREAYLQVARPVKLLQLGKRQEKSGGKNQGVKSFDQSGQDSKGSYSYHIELTWDARGCIKSAKATSATPRQ